MLGLYLGNACFLLAILTILLVRTESYIGKTQSKYYAILFIGAVEAYVIMDALFMKCFLTDNERVGTFRIIVFLFYLVYVTMPYVWHLFMQSYMGIERSKRRKIVEAIPLILLLLIVIASEFTGILWKIDDNGVYTRGQIFRLFAVLNLFYYGYAFAQTCYMLMKRSSGGKRYILKSALFSVLPLIGILVNTYIIPL